MTKGRPTDHTTKLLDQFENSKTSTKSKRKKNEKLINIFYRRFYNICRSLADGTNTNPQFLEIKKIMSTELQLIVQSKLWPKKFIHKSEQALYSGLKKSQFSIKSCKLIRKAFKTFSDAVIVYSNILTSCSEKELEKLFKYQCIGEFAADVKKKLWVGLIKDHLAQVGIEKAQRNNKDLMALINEIPDEENIRESQKVALEDLPTNSSLFCTNALQDEKWDYLIQDQDANMEIFEEESTLPSTEDESDKLFPCAMDPFHFYSSDSIGECDFTGRDDVEDFLNFS
ncbi:unnamed protein product [Blepharisma stoltei]|uniref:Uncharacterized protein n=1 Tax=Blepharisma stoltei TaxID=1481888 RepID=A0AAU9JUU2_9CILI|nr:unnamed protein product [Blepharisma stoltei]